MIVIIVLKILFSFLINNSVQDYLVKQYELEFRRKRQTKLDSIDSGIQLI